MSHGSFDEYAKRLAKIAWFAKVGKPSDQYDLAAGDWPAAQELLESDAFGHQKMNAQNALTNYLFHHNMEEYRAWNDVVDLAWAMIDAEKEKLLKAISSEDERERVWKRCRAMLTLAFSEAWYSDMAPQEHRFGREAFEAFEAGRLPCGYVGEFPKGKFQVY
jgi:DNA primase